MYLSVANNKLIGANVSSYSEGGIDYPITNIEVSEEIYNAYIQDNDRYIYSDGAIIENPDYKEIKRQKEQERLNALTMTKADFWIALLDRDITKNDVIEKINLIPDEKLKAKTLIRINDADHFWRGDASMDVVGAMFGITSQDLNYLFEHKELPDENPDV